MKTIIQPKLSILLKSNNFTDILYLEGEINYTRFYMANGSVIVSSRHLGYHMAHHLGGNFLRIHKSICVNKAYFDSFDYDQNPSFVFLKNGKELPISRRRQKESKLLKQR